MPFENGTGLNGFALAPAEARHDGLKMKAHSEK